jgi:hypothetical protein
VRVEIEMRAVRGRRGEVMNAVDGLPEAQSRWRGGTAVEVQKIGVWWKEEVRLAAVIGVCR